VLWKSQSMPGAPLCEAGGYGQPPARCLSDGSDVCLPLGDRRIRICALGLDEHGSESCHGREKCCKNDWTNHR